MAKIIKVGSQSPTFTSQKVKKASPLHTQRNSNEATNPFKFTNFEGNTLQFADVFEGFKPSFKSSPANKLRIIASSVAGSMNKMRTSITEPIVNFVRRVRTGIVSAWDYAKNTNIELPSLEIAGLKRVSEILNTPVPMPELKGLKNGISSSVDFLNQDVLDLGKGVADKWNGLVSKVSFHGKQKYSTMSVAELETHLAAALAEGGINE